MKTELITLALVAIFMTSCKSSYYYTASYNVQLATVESPADAKKQFGETKVVNFKDGEVNKYRYEDDYIEIIWYVSAYKFYFDLRNKSNYTIKINWDDISYVDYDGKVGRVMHSGVKYIDRNSSQPATTIPKDASIKDVLVPTENVYLIPGLYGGWREKLLIPGIYSSREAFANSASTYIGKTMRILMPIMIENVQNDYTYEFSIESLLNPEVGKKK
jgi:hypothetical protein